MNTSVDLDDEALLVNSHAPDAPRRGLEQVGNSSLDHNVQPHDVSANGTFVTHTNDRNSRKSFHSSTSLSSDLELEDMRPAYIADDEEAGLTAALKAEGSNDNTRQSLMLESRRSIEEDDVWEEARRIGKRAFIRKVVTNAILIGLW